MKILLQLLCVSLIFSCINNQESNEQNIDEIKETITDEETENLDFNEVSGWTQSYKSMMVKECQEGWGDYTQESKGYCECILRKCMEKWDSSKEMERDLEDWASDIDMEEWVRSCIEETN